MTAEEIKKLRDENQQLRDALANMTPDSSKLSDMLSSVEGVMGKESEELKKLAKQLESFPAQLSKMSEFLSSPEAKKAMEKFQKDK